MPYNPSLPADHSPIVAAELRNQFNALKALNDAQAAQIAALTAQVADLTNQVNNLSIPVWDDIMQSTANSVSAVQMTSFTVSDPPTQSEVQALEETLYGLVAGLHR